MFKAILDLLFPPVCVGCGKLWTFVCPQCYNSLIFIPTATKISNKQIHLTVFSALAYQGVARNLVRTFKFNPVPSLATPIAALLNQSLTLPPVTCVTAVPLHQHRLHERGFNQAELVGRELAQLVGVPYCSLLARAQHTAPQASITTRAERLQRMTGVFTLAADPHHTAHGILDHVLLVDDVFTTGATLLECATVLQKCGVQKISAVTIAHGA